jgi:hypothetical protein
LKSLSSGRPLLKPKLFENPGSGDKSREIRFQGRIKTRLDLQPLGSETFTEFTSDVSLVKSMRSHQACSDKCKES